MQPNEHQPYIVSAPEAPADVPPPTYTGNSTDNTAVLAMLAGAFMVITSCTFGFGSCLLPLFGLIGGIIGLRSTGRAVDPSRTRTYSIIAIATSAIFLLFILAIVALYGAVFFAAFVEAMRQSSP